MELNNNNTPVIYETDLFMGSILPPNGHIILRYMDGRNYTGTVTNGIPNGFGIQTGYYWIYEGRWLNGILICGTMTHIYTKQRFIINGFDISL